MTEINDKSLLRCTWNKSVDIFKKVLLVVSVVLFVVSLVVVSLLGLVIIVKGLELFWTYLWTDVYYWLEIIISPVITFLFGIPWYVYAGGVVVLAIPVYSLVWCIARELTDEDWKSESAKDIAFVLAALVATALAALAALVVLVALTIAIALALVLAFVLAFVLPITLAFANNYKIYLFPGAYLHYRKRTEILKESEKKELRQSEEGE
jgi:hypothetical protein